MYGKMQVLCVCACVCVYGRTSALQGGGSGVETFYRNAENGASPGYVAEMVALGEVTFSFLIKHKN